MPAILHRFSNSILVDAPLKKVFPFFSDPRNLEALTPPFLRFHILGETPRSSFEGQVIDYRLRLKGLPLHWRTLISRWEPPKRFVDVAVKSPYAFWHHTHRFRAEGRRTRMTDTVLYSLPFSPFSDWLAGAWVRRDVERIFAHRAQVIEELFPPKKKPGPARLNLPVPHPSRS